MQRKTRLIVTALCAAAAVGWAATAAMMSIQVKKADLRDTPSFLGNIVTSLGYGDRVSVVQENGAWYRVSKADGTAGWLHSSALTTKTIVMTVGGGAQTGASSGEMALAGKGFNADIEKEFKSSHRNIDFTGVDRMEAIKIAPATLQAFAKEGNLAAQGGVR